TEDAVSPDETVDLSTHGYLVIPPDLTNYRMNIGVRTLDSGATLNIVLYGANGTVRATRNGVTYPPNYFEQVSVNQFTGAATIDPGGSIYMYTATTSGGSAIIYGTVVDNRTSDSSYRTAIVK